MPYPTINKKLSIRFLLSLSFIIQILAAVGLTGWFSFRHGHKVVQDMALKLGDKVMEGIDMHVHDYLNKPYLIHEINVAAIEAGSLDLQDFTALSRHFRSLIEHNLGMIFAFGNQRGEVVSILSEANGDAYLAIKDASTAPYLETYRLDEKGSPLEMVNQEKFTLEERPWYKTPVNNNKPTWSPIFTSLALKDLHIGAAHPLYDEEGILQGVFNISFTLKELSEFLRSLQISEHGEQFIIERSGAIVATSADEEPFIRSGNIIKRLHVLDSSNPLIRATAEHLLEEVGDFYRVKKDGYCFLSINGKNVLVQLMPFFDPRGIDWLIVVAIPEEDFMKQVHINTRTTIILCFISLVVATIVSWQTSRWIFQPLAILIQASQRIAHGEWDQKIPVGHSLETAALSDSFNKMAKELKEIFATLELKVRERTADLNKANLELKARNVLIRRIFGRYLTDEIVANLLEKPEGLKLGGERRTITMLTSDLRGFTALAERLAPEQVVQVLNFYFEVMADVITSHKGTIDEFMGDGILVLFGAPIPRVNDAQRAVACAVEMQLAMDKVNRKMKHWGLSELTMGIGINTGEVVVGNIGSEKRTKYGVVGSNVNLAYRIESYTTAGQILISEQTLYKADKSIIKTEGNKQVQAKGVKQPITIYEVSGIGGKYNLYLPQEEEVFVCILEAIPVQYKILKGKDIKDEVFSGSIVELSAHEAKIKVDDCYEHYVPPVLTNIKLNFFTRNNWKEVSDDVYAKVIQKTDMNSDFLSVDKDSFYIHFTSKPPQVKAMLREVYQSL